MTDRVTEPLHPVARDLRAPARAGSRRYPPPRAGTTGRSTTRGPGRAKVKRRYSLIPTICFNCEAACGLLAYVDKQTLQIQKFEGNPDALRAAAAATAPRARPPQPDHRSRAHPLPARARASPRRRRSGSA